MKARSLLHALAVVIAVVLVTMFFFSVNVSTTFFAPAAPTVHPTAVRVSPGIMTVVPWSSSAPRLTSAPPSELDDDAYANASIETCSHFLFSDLEEEKVIGNQRAVIPLLLTSVKYHGIRLLKRSMKTWIHQFLIPQGNIDVILFYDAEVVNASSVIQELDLIRSAKNNATSASDAAAIIKAETVNVTLSAQELDILGTGEFLTPHHNTFTMRVLPVRMTFPTYIVANPSLLDTPSWMTCGCPPFCPARRAPLEYVQGTRWYSHDMFYQPTIVQYTYFLKLDVDIWFFRKIDSKLNMVNELITNKKIFAHTGYTYNGNKCSDELQDAMWQYMNATERHAVSEREAWWIQDDKTYYTNFVFASVAFFLHPDVRNLTGYLNEFPDGFFKHRWTDQSVMHKILGAFCGPREKDFLLDWFYLRCPKMVFHKHAIFYHSKMEKTGSRLRKCTR